MANAKDFKNRALALSEDECIIAIETEIANFQKQFVKTDQTLHPIFKKTSKTLDKSNVFKNRAASELTAQTKQALKF